MTCIELCAGMGGMSLGLQRAGYRHLLMVERDDRCIEALRKNGFDQHLLHADLTTVDFAQYRGQVDLVAGGVPCQPFSSGGKGTGQHDERNLFEHAIRCVDECRPRAFLFENVAGLTRPQFAAYLHSILGRLSELGYRVTHHVVDATHYGCPQRRKRCLIVGTKAKKAKPFAPPPPTTPQPITVRQMMHDLGPPDHTETVDRHTLHHRVPRAYKNHLPSQLDKPAKTLLAGANGPGGGTNCIVLDDGSLRYFTLREMARLQSFPDSYVLDPVWSHAVMQLGNAAPPALICEFAKQLR